MLILYVASMKMQTMMEAADAHLIVIVRDKEHATCLLLVKHLPNLAIYKNATTCQCQILEFAQETVNALMIYSPESLL